MRNRTILLFVLAVLFCSTLPASADFGLCSNGEASCLTVQPRGVVINAQEADVIYSLYVGINGDGWLTLSGIVYDLSVVQTLMQIESNVSHEQLNELVAGQWRVEMAQQAVISTNVIVLAPGGYYSACPAINSRWQSYLNGDYFFNTMQLCGTSQEPRG